MPTRGVVYVHSSPPAVCPHVEWAIGRVLVTPATLEWSKQSADPTTLRTECTWSGAAGTGSQIAAALKQWPMLRFEVTEEPSPGVDGERIMYVPGRGVFRATMSANGDLVVPEDRLRALLSGNPGAEAIRHSVEKLLGASWDTELEPFRHAGDGAPATWLTQVS
ncbi:hypothetical protein Afil01_45480 [Actinorhabdospora filicis]|uniref:DUF3145 domain-containing protein n=1 Tax=Actinorhabdospora filicis TaxID=1785913 RepID=A0A9W6SPF0_9ACTN|nr:DUF3145 domain-containing protein [Actinorhabdospora filicis]GLZ79741.1 hypothetical protein Afil01_45480 [Actinorhabdospora filicis]